MAKELKPCPFCGADAAIITACYENVCGDDCNCDGCDDCTYAICCSMNSGGCGASSGYRASVDKAIEAWNRRASDA